MSDLNKKTERLTEIKAGKTGYGLLIESDGYVSGDLSENNKRLVKEAFEVSDGNTWNVPNPFVLDVVLQKYGIENANRRIYPEHILKREVEKYQNMIRQKMALGECYKPDVLVSTVNGWMELKDVKEGDLVYTLNTKTNKTEFQPVLRKVEYDYDGVLFTLDSELISDAVTNGHEFPIYNKEHKFECFKSAEELSNEDWYHDGMYIPVDDIETGIELDSIKYGFIRHRGKVMCIEVENHTWFVMSNGKSHWTKNCNHPDSSTIDLGRISHNITECHWEGHTLVGKIEFNITEGFRRYGICSSLGDTCANLILNGYKIGVSSRGIGSVKTQLGKTIVDEDFELICWDLVQSPSTPGSYLGDYQELKQYIESDETKNSGQRLNEKINKINKILNA